MESSSAAEALARYLGEDYEAYTRQSGRQGVRLKKPDGKPNYGTTKVSPLSARINTERAPMQSGIPQGSPVPY